MEQLPTPKQEHIEQQKVIVKPTKIKSSLHVAPQKKKETIKSSQLIQSMNQQEKHLVVINQVPAKPEVVQLTKRSDEQQFVNWQISTVKSGKFCFVQKKQSLSSVGKLNIQDENTLKQPKKNVKLMKSVSCHKKFIQENFIAQFREILLNHKLVKVIFTHFCKESHLVSIKTALFQEKHKQGEEMTLNKWMVFCKQFQILIKICRLKYMSRQSRVVQETQLSNSQVRQVFQTKEVKQVEQRLTKIFKKVSKNLLKMTYECFVEGLIQIYQEFDPVYLHQEKGITEFLADIMHSAEEKTCFKKLSNLKCITATPKISYDKTNFRKGQVRSRAKSRIGKDKNKQNSKDQLQKSFHQAKSSASHKNFTKLNMNPIIRDAKRILKECETNKKEFISHTKSTHKLKLTNEKKIDSKGKGQNDLIKYFQSTKDPILDSYFMHEKDKQNIKKGRF